MLKHLNREYSKYKSDHKSWKNGLFASTVVLLIFLLFQPFGFRDKVPELKVVLFSGYALFASVYSLLSFRIIRNILTKKKIWTLKHELLGFLIGMILFTLVVHLFTYWVTGDMPLTFRWYLKLLYHVASLFLLIGVIEFFYYNYRSVNINNKQLSSQYKIAKQKLDNVKRQNQDIISVSLEKEQIEINRNKIICIQSIGNYLEFYLREPNGKINKISKRGRLHRAEKDLASFFEFFRCHRAFIINLKQVVYIKGNIKNARVILEGEPIEIPVSRSLYKNLKERVAKITLS